MTEPSVNLSRKPRRAPERVLIIRPSALGDVCRSVGVLALLRGAFPAAQIDWLVQDTFADAVRHHPALSGVIEFPRAAMSSWWKSPRAARRTVGFFRMLRARRYDLVLDCQGLLRSGLFAWGTGAPERLGYADAAEGGAWFVNRRVAAPRTLHTVDRMMRLAEAAIGGFAPAVAQASRLCSTIPDLRLYTSEADRAWVSGKLHEHGVAGGYAVLAPTSRWEGKRWPAERYAEVAKRLLDDPRAGIAAVAVVGGPGPREAQQAGPLIELAKTDRRVVSLVGGTTVGRLMALIEGSALVIANDSAALHMAVGFDRPYVALFGPTDTALVGPYTRGSSRHGVVLQHLRPGEHLDHKDDALGQSYMQRITVDEVMDALNTVTT